MVEAGIDNRSSCPFALERDRDIEWSPCRHTLANSDNDAVRHLAGNSQSRPRLSAACLALAKRQPISKSAGISLPEQRRRATDLSAESRCEVAGTAEPRASRDVLDREVWTAQK